MVALLFIGASQVGGDFAMVLIAALVALAVGCTILFLMGGRERVEEVKRIRQLSRPPAISVFAGRVV